jgi:anti-sigma-K factor RskA
MNTSKEMHLDVGCYVVDALEDDERRELEAHLTTCERCRQEALEFAETAAELSRTVTARPPQATRDSMLAAISQIRPVPPLPDELALRRVPRTPGRSRILIGLAAAAAVITLALGGWVFNVVQSTPSEVAAQSAAQRETDLLQAPDAQVRSVTAAGALYTFVVSKQRNEALFIPTDLADPGAGKTYQLWTLEGRRAFPDATVDRDVLRQWFTGSVTDATSLAVTIEPEGGSAQPTPPILAQVTV